jgi:hypothetical protein
MKKTYNAPERDGYVLLRVELVVLSLDAVAAHPALELRALEMTMRSPI